MRSRKPLLSSPQRACQGTGGLLSSRGCSMLGQRWTTLQELPAFHVLKKKKTSLLESTGLQLHLVTKLSQLGKKKSWCCRKSYGRHGFSARCVPLQAHRSWFAFQVLSSHPEMSSATTTPPQASPHHGAGKPTAVQLT